MKESRADATTARPIGTPAGTGIQRHPPAESGEDDSDGPEHVSTRLHSVLGGGKDQERGHSHRHHENAAQEGPRQRAGMVDRHGETRPSRGANGAVVVTEGSAVGQEAQGAEDRGNGPRMGPDERESGPQDARVVQEGVFGSFCRAVDGGRRW